MCRLIFQNRVIKRKIAPSLILSSPYVRAKQTADIAASVLSAGTVQFLESLYPHSDPEDTIIDINALDVDEILLVGHDPHMSDLLSLLVCGSRDVFSLKKSAIAAVEFSGKLEAGLGNLKWLLTPGLVG